MYDTAKRVALVKQQVRENTRRRQRRGIYGLSAACMLLFAVMMQAADVFAVQEQTAAWGVFGAMLLREDVGGYVLVAVVSFAAAVVVTVFCTRLRKTINSRNKPRRMRKHEEKIFSGAAEPVHDAHAAANYGVCSGERFARQHTRGKSGDFGAGLCPDRR